MATVSRTDVTRNGYKQYPAHVVVGALANQLGSSWEEEVLVDIIENWLDGPDAVPPPDPTPDPDTAEGIFFRTAHEAKVIPSDTAFASLASVPDGSSMIKTTDGDGNVIVSFRPSVSVVNPDGTPVTGTGATIVRENGVIVDIF